MKYLSLLLFLLFSQNLFSQLGFCEGSKGDPIFHEDFEWSASGNSQLPSGVTTYSYHVGDPPDGSYTLTNTVGQQNSTWHSYFPESTISNGQVLIVNADDSENFVGKFYEIAIPDLCENTTYEFSAFLMNVYNRSEPTCANGGIPNNVKFQIWDETDSELLAEGDTGDIHSTNTPKWEQYALTFQTEAGQNSVILKMFNNGRGGCGNDLAIDDIIFRSCGDLTEITSENDQEGEYYVCEPDAPASLTLTAKPDHSVYEQHAFQWQESDDNENWSDIPGENSESFTTPQLSESRYFRVKIAEDEVNLSNNLCSSASDAFRVVVIEPPEPPQSNGDIAICGGDLFPALSVQVGSNETANWYAAETGGEPLATQTTTFTPQTAGTFYAEAVPVDGDCKGSERTAVNLTINENPEVEDESLQLCAESEIELDAGLANMTYNWSTGESSRRIVIDRPGNFEVIITTEEGCSVTRNFNVTAVDVAGIDEIISEEGTVTIVPAYDGEFEYSINGNNFQSSNTFRNVGGGVYTAYVRDLENCATASEEFPHIVVPKFITPNGDGYNDTFRLRGVEYFEASEIKIFDRYGKLLKAGPGQNFSWDGTFNGRKLPASDYWYEINIEDYPTKKGHFSLKH